MDLDMIETHRNYLLVVASRNFVLAIAVLVVAPGGSASGLEVVLDAPSKAPRARVAEIAE